MVNVSGRGFRGFSRYLTHLVGDWRRPMRDGTEVTDVLREKVSDAWIDGLSDQQFDFLERTVSAVLGALRTHIFLKQGYTLRPWRPSSPRQPGVCRSSGYGHRFYDWRHDLSGWLDHPYRLTRRDEQGRLRETFISEPYSLSEDGLRSLVTLAEEGWRVSVTAEWALHYPGSTLRVSLSRKDDPA